MAAADDALPQTKAMALTVDELKRLSWGYPILARMIANGMPLDRETYILLGWGPDAPEHWAAENETQLPPPFRLTQG